MDGLRARRHTPLVTSERAAIKAWRRGHEAANQRRVELLIEEGPAPERAVAEGLSALEALALAGEWPGPRDAMSERSVEEVRARWVRIERRAQAQYKH